MCNVRLISRTPGLDYIARRAPRLRIVRVAARTNMFTHLACSVWGAHFLHCQADDQPEQVGVLERNGVPHGIRRRLCQRSHRGLRL
jgi:hypothetical protein